MRADLEPSTQPACTGQSESPGASGVFGANRLGFGTTGVGITGVHAVGQGAAGLLCESNIYAIFARSQLFAGIFEGDVSITGSSQNALSVTGNTHVSGSLTVIGPIHKSGGGFRIDHPTDPANQYLNHSFVESPERKNVYDGVVSLDKKGEADVHMPDWFDAVNTECRYQLTAVGAPGPNLYIARGMTKNSFRIAGGSPGAKVSWQVTGIRKDPWAQQNPLTVEEKKSRKDRGRFLDPALYKQPPDKAIAQREPNPDPIELMKKARKGLKLIGDRPGLLPAESKMPRGLLNKRSD